MAEFAICVAHDVAGGTDVGIICYIHLCDGINYGVNVIIIAESGCRPMISCGPCRGPTFEMGAVGLSEVGFDIGSIFPIRWVRVPRYDSLNKQVRLLDLVLSWKYRLRPVTSRTYFLQHTPTHAVRRPS